MLFEAVDLVDVDEVVEEVVDAGVDVGVDVDGVTTADRSEGDGFVLHFLHSGTSKHSLLK